MKKTLLAALLALAIVALASIGAWAQTPTPNNAWWMVPVSGTAAAAGAVSSVSNSDGSLAISPTTGAVVASVNQANNFAWTGTQDFSGTTTPTLAAGHVIVGGVMTAPTFNASDEGAIYLSSTNGLILQGQGSTNDWELVNKSGTVACRLPTGATTLVCLGLTASIGSNSTVVSGTFSNTNSGSSAQTVLGIGNNTSNSEGAVTVNSSANTSGNGANSVTINGAAGVWLQGGGTNGFAVTSGGVPEILGTPQLASSTTGSGTQTFTNSPCGTLTTERWIPVTIVGQTGTWNIPACQ